MGPRADFVCNAKGCRMKNGAAKVYELPIKATHCPMGHKRIVRLYNAINIGRKDRLQPRLEPVANNSSSLAKRLDAVVEGPVSQAIAKKEELERAARHRDVRVGFGQNMQQVMAKALTDVNPGYASVIPRVATAGETKQKAVVGGTLGGVIGAGVPPIRQATDITLRDRSHRLVKKADGSLDIERAT